MIIIRLESEINFQSIGTYLQKKLIFILGVIGSLSNLLIYNNTLYIYYKYIIHYIYVEHCITFQDRTLHYLQCTKYRVMFSV